MKFVTFILVALLVVFTFCMATVPVLLGFAPWHLGHALHVSTHMSAKLACSARYISGYSPERIVEDLASYSPVNRQVNLQYQEAERTVQADLFGLAGVTAKYYPATGCALQLLDAEPLAGLTAPVLPAQAELDWPAGERLSSVQPQLQQQLDQMLAQDNQQGLETRALLVVKDGQLLAESYADGVTAQTPLLGWSMAKSVTAMLLGRLIQQGQLQLDDQALFAAWARDQRSGIRLQQLLQMSSGLGFDETYAPGSDATHMLFTAASAADVALQSPLLLPPGQQFSYSSGTTNLLSRLLSDRIPGGPQATVDFANQQLFAPLGMQHFLFEMDPSGDFVGSSYLYASARDWARLGLLMLQQGQFNGQQLLDAKWVQQATAPNSSDNEKAYGFQFWLNSGDAALRWPELPADAYAMMGNRHQTVMMIPSQNTVLVRLGWSKTDYPMASNFRLLLSH